MYMIVNKARGKIWFSLFGAMAGVLAARAETVSGTPDAYLDYIEATGQQYINTGVNAETGLKARADFSWGTAVTSSDDWGLLCAKDGKSSDNSTRMLMIHLGNNKPYIGYGLASRGNPGNATTFTRNVRGEIVADFSDYNESTRTAPIRSLPPIRRLTRREAMLISASRFTHSPTTRRSSRASCPDTKSA